MTAYERQLAQRVIRRGRRVLELRRQLALAERQLQDAHDALAQRASEPVADQATALSVGS